MSRILTVISVCVIITPLLSNVVGDMSLWRIILWWVALCYIAWKVSDKIE